MRIGFIGAGNMAAAMARGWAGADRSPEAMLFFDVEAERARSLAEEVGGEDRPTATELASDVDAVVLAVKPAALDDAADSLDHGAPALISILAGTPLERVAEAFPGVAVIRVMPNQPAEVRRGVICHSEPLNMNAELERELLELLGALGTPKRIGEHEMDVAMALMSCSPAYIALIAEALADAGEREGLHTDLAAELVAQSLAGTAELLEVKDPVSIRRTVAPPGGATEAGLRTLEEAGLERALADAVQASLERFR
jgi:pyrroline-5-carboxylate reductase